MRIPVTQADWPEAFNRFSKYIAKQWPSKVKLNQAREITAKLFGYSSCHDVTQTLQSSGDSTPAATSCSLIGWKESLATRAYRHYGLEPKRSKEIASKSPFFDFHYYGTACESDKNSAQEVVDAFKRQYATELSKIPNADTSFIKNEYNDPMDVLEDSYRCPKGLIELQEKDYIPCASFAVRRDGMVFVSDSFYKIIKGMDVSEDLAIELGYERNSELSASAQMIYKLYQDQGFIPLDEYLDGLTIANHHTYNLGSVLELRNTTGWGFVIFNLWFDGYYPICIDWNDNAGFVAIAKRILTGDLINQDKHIESKIVRLGSDSFGLRKIEEFPISSMKQTEIHGQPMYLHPTPNPHLDELTQYYGAFRNEFATLSSGLEYDNKNRLEEIIDVVKIEQQLLAESSISPEAR